MMQFVYLEDEEKIIKKETTISFNEKSGNYLNMLIPFFMPNAFLWMDFRKYILKFEKLEGDSVVYIAHSKNGISSIVWSK